MGHQRSSSKEPSTTCTAERAGGETLQVAATWKNKGGRKRGILTEGARAWYGENGGSMRVPQAYCGGSDERTIGKWNKAVRKERRV